MGETTGIAWTDSTINVWHGCDKVSPGCKHCYAEVSTPVRVKRAGRPAVEARAATDDMPAVKARLAVAPVELWGPKAARSETKGWERDLRRWNREVLAEQATDPLAGRFVFAQSLSDTFEDREDECVISAKTGERVLLSFLRAWFLKTIAECPALTFQLLTKRPENIRRMVPPSWLDRWPAHVWIGTTVEDQQRADERIPHLLWVPAAVRFLSVEPQLEAVDLRRWIAPSVCCEDCEEITEGLPLDADGTPDETCPACGEEGGLITTWGEAQAERWASRERYANGGPHDIDDGPQIQWVICGGESGSKARPFDLAWARALRDQCKAAGCAYFLKQLGARPIETAVYGAAREEHQVTLVFADSHGANESEWPEDLRGCRAFPEAGHAR